MRNFCLILLVFAASLADAASFDCTNAASPREKVICASPALNAAESQLNTAYKAFLAAMPAEFAAEARRDERSWLGRVDVACRGSESEAGEVRANCMLGLYTERIAELQSRILTEGGVKFFWRSINLTWPDEPGTSSGLEETPGFGTMRATWPQSTNNSAEWMAWNKAIEAAAQSLVMPEGGKNPSGKWLKEWAADGDFEITASLGLVSEELVTASIGLEGTGHGAAHPSEAGIEFNWLLKQKRELRPDDVFRKDSDWERTIEARCSVELQQPDAGLYDDWKNTLPKVVLDPRNWQLDGKGLTIDFPEYSVSPRASPVSPVTIPWATLKPILKPGFTIPRQEPAAKDSRRQSPTGRALIQ